MTDLSRSADELARIAVELATRVRDVDPERNGTWLAAVLPEPGDWFRLCFVLATAVHQLAFPSVKQGDGSLTGNILAIEKLPGAKNEPATEWACRFVTSHINGDGDTNASLFFANLADEDLILGGVVALVAMAGDIARHAEQERAA